MQSHLTMLAGWAADPATTDLAKVTRQLDQLHAYRVLDRSYDGARAASLAEYRNRHSVYQFTQAGYRAYRAVEDVLGASVDGEPAFGR